jgi:hypothetical protein
MPPRRGFAGFASCAICAAAGFVATDASVNASDRDQPAWGAGMPVVRISLGRFDAANYDAVRKLLDDSQKTLVPANRRLKGNRAYYAGIDRENNAMTNVSVWTRAATPSRWPRFNRCSIWPRFLSRPGCVSKDRSPIAKRSGRCNFVGLYHRRQSRRPDALQKIGRACAAPVASRVTVRRSPPRPSASRVANCNREHVTHYRFNSGPRRRGSLSELETAAFCHPRPEPRRLP